MLDRIVGRCVREPEFAAAVLADPDSALAEYVLNEDELDDFRALSSEDLDWAASSWADLRSALESARAAPGTPARSAVDPQPE